MRKAVRVRFGFLIWSLWAFLSGVAQAVEGEKPPIPATPPEIQWKDDSGRVRSFKDLRGSPTILLPIYARCNTACLTTTSTLKKALLDVKADPTSYQVLLFSFDPSDGPESLSQFRAREKIPLTWRMGSASAAEAKALMEFINFQYAQSEGEFLHPNRLVILDSKQRVARSISGTRYRASEIEQALKSSGGIPNDWEKLPAYWLAFSILVLTLSAVYLSHLVFTKKPTETKTFKS